MPNLKDLRLRVKSVQSTKKITSAMKMISAAKLKKAHAAIEASRPYTYEMEKMIFDLIHSRKNKSLSSRLLEGTGQDKTHLLVVVTSNRGLCGGFNSTIARATSKLIQELTHQGKEILLIVVGKKGQEQLSLQFKDLIYSQHLAMTQPRFFNAESLANDVLKLFNQGRFDVCTLIYNKFVSALSQVVTQQQLIPACFDPQTQPDLKPAGTSIYKYEPSEVEVLNQLLPRHLKVQLYLTLLESTASEHGARMAAMDGATRNASELIDSLNLTYNRTRQAYITSELIEIISGADAL
jgi:F-type H+-transporting ATPase subunit gamma